MKSLITMSITYATMLQRLPNIKSSQLDNSNSKKDISLDDPRKNKDQFRRIKLSFLVQFFFPAYIYVYIYIYIYIYSRYHTITDVYTTASLLLTKPSSDDDSGFRHGFGAEASLPLTQSAPAVSHDTTRLYQVVVALWDCQIHADAVRDLSWIFSMYFLLSNGGSPRLVKKTEVELAIKPLHLTSIGNTFVIQPFLIHCSCRSSYFSNLHSYIYIYIYIDNKLLA